MQSQKYYRDSKIFALTNLDLAVLLRAKPTYTLILLLGIALLSFARQFLFPHLWLATIHRGFGSSSVAKIHNVYNASQLLFLLLGAT